MNERCHCGLELHYTDEKIKQQVQEVIDRFGPFIDVVVGGRTFRVQRHYIALHGIKGKDVAQLGFKEVTNQA